jgi:hypothetical protein
VSSARKFLLSPRTRSDCANCKTGRYRKKGSMLINSQRNYQRALESMLHPGVRRVNVPGNRAWCQLLLHEFTAAFTVFLHLGCSFRFATNMLLTPKVESIRYHSCIHQSLGARLVFLLSRQVGVCRFFLILASLCLKLDPWITKFKMFTKKKKLCVQL